MGLYSIRRRKLSEKLDSNRPVNIHPAYINFKMHLYELGRRHRPWASTANDSQHVNYTPIRQGWMPVALESMSIKTDPQFVLIRSRSPSRRRQGEWEVQEWWASAYTYTHTYDNCNRDIQKEQRPTAPSSGYKNPAPTDARTSRTGMTKSCGSSNSNSSNGSSSEYGTHGKG